MFVFKEHITPVNFVKVKIKRQIILAIVIVIVIAIEIKARVIGIKVKAIGIMVREYIALIVVGKIVKIQISLISA